MVLEDLTPEQFAAVVAALDNIESDSELAQTFNEMADDNVTVRISVSDTLPPNASPDARATISFNELQNDMSGTSEKVQPNSEVTITILESAINSSSVETSFEGLLAHEFTHLVREDGRFLKDTPGPNDPPTSTHDRDVETYNNLYEANLDSLSQPPSANTGFNPINYSESIDYSHYQSVQDGVNVMTGTDGNNLLRADNLQSGGRIYSGAGNDFILGGYGIDGTVIDGGGMKIIYEPYDSVQFDGVTVLTVATASDFVLTAVGGDLYVTDQHSSVSPIDDPNAVVLVNQVYNPQHGIEFLVAADGTTVQPYGFYASRTDGSLAAQQKHDDTAAALASVSAEAVAILGLQDKTLVEFESFDAVTYDLSAKQIALRDGATTYTSYSGAGLATITAAASMLVTQMATFDTSTAGASLVKSWDLAQDHFGVPFASSGRLERGLNSVPSMAL